MGNLITAYLHSDLFRDEMISVTIKDLFFELHLLDWHTGVSAKRLAPTSSISISTWGSIASTSYPYNEVRSLRRVFCRVFIAT